MKLSLVVPCYNEAENVAEFQKTVIQTFENEAYEYEIVFVDDGSRDRTPEILHSLSLADERCKYISFSRNFSASSIVSSLVSVCGGSLCCECFEQIIS